MKKVISLLLVLLMLLSVLAGCAKTDDEDDKETGNQNAVTVEGDSLEERDYEGKVFRILSREDTLYEFEGDMLGSNVQQAVVEREYLVEDRFNTDIQYDTVAGNWDNRKTYIERVQNMVLSGNTEEVSIGSTHTGYLSSIALAGYALDMKQLPNLDLNSEWWNPNYTENATVNDKIYFTVGDINLTLYERLEVVYFNKTLASNYSLGDLYDMALNGKWTYEVLYNMIANIGSYEEGQELYAVGMNCHAIRGLTTSWNISLTRANDTTGKQELYLNGNQKLVDGYSRFYRLIQGNVSHCPFTNSMELGTQTPLFLSDKMMFWFQTLGATEELRDMDSEYGILPVPLWNEDQYLQTGYISSVADNHNGVFVVSRINESDYDFVGMILEALCMYSRDTVVEEYYEDNIKLRTDRSDPRIMEVLDLVRDGLYFTFAQAWSVELDYVYSYYSRAWTNATYNQGVPDAEITTQINKLVSSQTELLKKLYDTLDTLE